MATSGDIYKLKRFVEAQLGVYETALAELRAGKKRTHWMWFILPQLRGLGLSEFAIYYGITGLAEARAYLDHPILGPRLRTCVQAVLPYRDVGMHEVFGSPDDMKFRSCLTLFERAEGDGGLFGQALDVLYGEVRCELTLTKLAGTKE